MLEKICFKSFIYVVQARHRVPRSGAMTSVVMQVGKALWRSMRVNALRDLRTLGDSWSLFVPEQRLTKVTTCAHQQKKSFKKEGGHVFKAERYAIGQLGIFGIYATCKMPLQTVLISLDLPSQRAGLGSLKLGELRKAAQFTYNVLVLVA